MTKKKLEKTMFAMFGVTPDSHKMEKSVTPEKNETHSASQQKKSPLLSLFPNFRTL